MNVQENKAELQDLMEYLTYDQFKQLHMSLATGRDYMSEQTAETIWRFHRPKMSVELSTSPTAVQVKWVIDRLYATFRLRNPDENK